MAQNLSRTTFDPQTNRLLLSYSQGRPLLDSELDEQQRIRRFITELVGAASFGSGPVGTEAFLPVASGVDNSFVVLPGYGYDRGVLVRALQPLIVATRSPGGVPLSTPGANRTDYVVLEWWYREVDAIEDPSIIDPALAIETATREVQEVAILVFEGTLPDDPPAGRQRIRIATIEREAGNPAITTAMVVDERAKWRNTFVADGMRVSAGVGLAVTVDAGTYYAGDTQVVHVGGSVGSLPMSSTVFIYATAAGALAYTASTRPFNAFQVPLALVTTTNIGIESVLDLRFWQSVTQAVEREIRDARGTHATLQDYLLTEHNPDGTHNLSTIFAGGIDRENWRSLKPTAQDPASLKIDIAPGRYTAPSGTKTNDFPGGETPVLTSPNPLTGARIDLITINETNLLEVVEGVPSLATPLVPPYPDDRLVIAEVTVIPPPSGPAVVTDAEIRDVRPFLNIGYGPGVVTGAPRLYEIATSLADARYNGGSQVWTLNGSFVIGDHSLQVFRNGKLLTVGVDYAELTTNQVQLLFVPSAAGGNVFEFVVTKPDDGTPAAPRLYEQQLGSDSVDVGGDSEFTLTSGYYTPSATAPTLHVYRNGKRLVPGVDFLQASPNTILLNGYLADPADVFVFIVF